MLIQLNSPFTVKPAIITSTVTRHQVLDDTTAQKATAIIIVGQTEAGDNLYHTLTLWEGDAYTAAGQWTDTDVNNRIIELLNT